MPCAARRRRGRRRRGRHPHPGPAGWRARRPDPHAGDAGRSHSETSRCPCGPVARPRRAAARERGAAGLQLARTPRYRAAMPTVVDATQVAALLLALGATGATVRLLRARSRDGGTPAPVAAPAESGVEPPWAVVVANPTKFADAEREIEWLEERSVELGWARPVW